VFLRRLDVALAHAEITQGIDRQASDKERAALRNIRSAFSPAVEQTCAVLKLLIRETSMDKDTDVPAEA